MNVKKMKSFITLTESSASLTTNPMTQLKVGDQVRKKSGMKFRGQILAIYNVPHEEREWCVVILNKNFIQVTTEE